MSYSRSIEVTAKDENEARKLAEKQLEANEFIESTEVLSAPVRGLFGTIGKQECKVRYVIAAKPEVAAKAEPRVSTESIETQFPKTEKYNDDEEEDLSEMPVKRPRQRNDREFGGGNRWGGGNNNRRGNRDSRRQRRPRRGYDNEMDYGDENVNIPERPRTAVTEEILNNPLHDEMFDIVREVGGSVGVENIELAEFICDGAWVIDASGDNVSQLIGKHGKTLDSLQYLLNIIYNKGKDERTKIVLDAQGYREKRHRNLMMLAQRMQRKVLATGRQVELEPMSTLDRRTVHMALKDVAEVETFSKGVEPMRRVVIAMAQRKGGESDWQPLMVDEGDEGAAIAAVPMFMEDDV
jgi:predicted RNA-binding protein Jag